jgi:hypothetical protein
VESECMLMRQKAHHARALTKGLGHMERGYRPFPGRSRRSAAKHERAK